MTIELVDGHGGKPHISGEDLGDFKAGILGDAGYVFKRANMLAATLNGSNSITIATGSGIMPTSGRHFRVTAPETLTITSGTQGQNRNDLIVVRATTDEESTTVETATLVVLRGTPTSGTATDPATQDGDLPLYRLQLTGVSVAEPIALFDVMVPYSEFRDSISPSKATITELGNNARMLNYGNFHIVQLYGYSVPSGNHVIGNLPEGLKLIKNMSFDGALSSDTKDHTGNIWINSSGTIYCHKNTTESDTFSGQMCFFTE